MKGLDFRLKGEHRRCRRCVACLLHGSRACRRHRTWYNEPTAGAVPARGAPELAVSRPEVSARLSARIDAVEDELRRIVAVLSRKGDPVEHSAVKGALLAAQGHVQRARMLHIVPLFPARGRP